MKIWDLFKGYEKAHGRYEVKRVNDKGKNEGKAVTVKEPANQAHWENHINGKGAGLGIIPLRDDDTVYWGCIDIDKYTIDHKKLEAACQKLDLPLVICRSKSGGSHCFLFTFEPVEATIVVRALSTWAAMLGCGGCEIFPKQTQRYSTETGEGEGTDIGNWLNMPYYFAERTTRYCIHNGKDLDLIEFVEFAASMRQTADQIESKTNTIPGSKASIAPRDPMYTTDTGDKNDLFFEGPPCLQILHSMGGFPNGTRNEGMYNVAVYLRKRYPDDWENSLQPYNMAMSDPPLTIDELKTTGKSVKKKGYDFKCRSAPIAPYCNRKLCQGRIFGVGESSEGSARPEINEVKKIIGDPTIWYATINGKRLSFTTEELTTQVLFKRKLASQVNVYPRTLNPDRWDRFINDMIQGADIEYAPLDATPFGQFLALVENYVSGQVRATSKEKLLVENVPYLAGEGEVWFKLRGLLKHLDTQGYKYKSENHVAEMLKQAPLNGLNKTVHIKGRTIHVWAVKEPESVQDVDTDIKFGTEAF